MTDERMTPDYANTLFDGRSAIVWFGDQRASVAAMTEAITPVATAAST
jgi:hypothetical protein